VQIKLRVDADTKAEGQMRRGSIPNNGALPYLAILMELGIESVHRETRSKLRSTVPESPSDDGQFQQLANNWIAAVNRLAEYREKHKRSKKRIKELEEDVDATRLLIDFCNRYSIAVRGASSDTYGILKEADIVDEFATLLRTTMPSSAPQEMALQHMRPFERLGEGSHYTSWMSEYVITDSGDD
jgi:hypothetical protein